jgi:nucleotide-binding universal stress UspA family protein
VYKKMLVPLDGSELAEIALPYAEEVARAFDMEMILLHVCESGGSESEFMCHTYLDHAAEIATKASPKGKIKVQGEVADGHPAEEILEYAASRGADLILMATHGRSGLRRWALGSTADKVLRAAEVPVLMLRANHPEHKLGDTAGQMMLVPLDGSQYAEAVLPHVRALAAQIGKGSMNVVLVRVFEEPFVTADYPFPDWKEHVQRMRDHFREEADRYLAGVRDGLAAAGLKVRSEVLMGEPAESLIDYARHNEPELIIMASHGASGINRWEYGSIADKVLRGVASPVFMVHPG